MSLLRKASIVTTPTAYENGKILSVKPSIVLGNELVTNGNFANDTDWDKIGWTINNSQATANANNTSQYLQQDFTITNGKVYLFSYEIIENTLNGSGSSLSGFGGFISVPLSNAIGFHNVRITADNSSAVYALKIGVSGTATTGSIIIDNVSIKEAIDADFQFTRNSSATRTNSQGLIEDMQILSGDLVSNGDFSQEGSQLILNPNFNDNTWWGVESPAVEISNGKANFNTLLQNWGIYKNNTLTSGKQYKVLFTIDSYTSGGVHLNIGGGVVGSYTAIGTYTAYVTGGGTNVFAIQSDSGGAILSIDNVSIKEVGQDWTLSADSSIFQGFANVSSTGTYQYIFQSGILTVGKKYKVEYTILNGSTGTLKLGTSLGVSSIISTVGTHSVIANALTTDFLIERLTVCDVNITNIKIIEITSDTNLPRIDYTGGEGHWLFEPQSTNLITQSELFSDSYWNKSGSSVVSGFISPDGTSNAFKLVENTATTTHQIFRAFFYLNAKYSLSVFLKADGRNWIKMNLYDGTSSVYTYFDLTNGVVGQELGASGKIENYGNGWYKCSMSTTSVVSLGSGNISFRLAEFDGGTGYIGDGTSGVYVYGAQLEQNSFSTSYIPTEGSIKTRLQDAAFGAGSSDLINSTEGVLYAEIAALSNDGTNRIISLSDGTVANMLLILYQIGSNVIRTQLSVSGQSNIVIDVNSDTTISSKIAVKYDSTSIKFYLNGSKVGETSTGYTFSSNALDNLSFTYGSGILPFFGKAKCVAVFKEALNNDELECLTGEGYDSFNALALANNYTII